MVRSWRVLLTWDEAHGFVFGQLLLAGLELFRHLLVLGAFPKPLNVVVDGTVQLVLDTARTWLEVAWSACLDVASKLDMRVSRNDMVKILLFRLPFAGDNRYMRA